MPTTVTESLIFRDMFGTAAMRGVFSDEALVGRYLEVEVALARAEAATQVIPTEAADAIAEAARTMPIDFDRLRHETEITGYPIIAIVHQLAEAAGDAGGYVHWGATTQDIMDSATVLQVRAALDLVGADLIELRDILAALALKHRDTPMAGRTHLQQALPITFGYKVAVWLSMIERPHGIVGMRCAAGPRLNAGSCLRCDGVGVPKAHTYSTRGAVTYQLDCPRHLRSNGDQSYMSPCCFLKAVEERNIRGQNVCRRMHATLGVRDKGALQVNAHWPRQPGIVRSLDDLRNAEIEHPHGAAGRCSLDDENVVRLEIAMDDAQGVGGSHRGNDRQENRGGLLEGQLGLAGKLLSECFADQEIHDHDRRFVVQLEHVGDRHHVGVPDGARRASLA